MIKKKLQKAIKEQGTKDDLLREANDRFVQSAYDYVIPDLVKQYTETALLEGTKPLD